MQKITIVSAALAVCMAYTGTVAGGSSDRVTITPLGSNAGEFCGSDRAILFQDPSGINILIQPGRTIDGRHDPRLADIDVHVILLDHSHNDHVGERIDIDADAIDGNGCATVTDRGLLTGRIPNLADIAAGENSAVLVGGEKVPWLRDRIGAAEGASVGGCGASGLTQVTGVERVTPCVDTLRPGASRELALLSGPTGVRVSTVQAFHSDGITPAFTANPGLFPAGINGYGGTETGYVIRFPNGLSVYWSGDSGFFGDMKLFSEFYDVNLAVMHIGDIFTMGPTEAAFAVNKLIKPRSVIAAHANERATVGGIVNAGTKTELFISKVKSANVFVPLSGVPISCDGKGRCTQ